MADQKTIIICDDDNADRILFKKYIGADNIKRYTLLEAKNAEELFFILNNDTYSIDLIFLDYYLAETNGLELLRQIRKKYELPVVMITGQGDEGIAVECMKEGAIDYIPKEQLLKYDLPKTIKTAIDKWEIEQERDQLLGIAAHELRNPIATILGYTEILQNYKALEEKNKEEMIEIVRERANHMLNIINELLDITRIEKGIVNLKKQKIDLLKLVIKKITDYNILAANKNIIFNFSASLDKMKIFIDPDRIEEVLSNIFDNAVKYSPKNTQVDVTLNKVEEGAEIVVQDHGVGIKEEELKYLFKLFSNKKVNSLTTGKESSTGLGLAICKKVIEAHSGEITVQSNHGKGSTFKIILPNLEK